MHISFLSSYLSMRYKRKRRYAMFVNSFERLNSPVYTAPPCTFQGNFPISTLNSWLSYVTSFRLLLRTCDPRYVEVVCDGASCDGRSRVVSQISSFSGLPELPVVPAIRRHPIRSTLHQVEAKFVADSNPQQRRNAPEWRNPVDEDLPYNASTVTCRAKATKLYSVTQKKSIHLTFGHNFRKCRSIFKILSLTDS